MAEELEASRIRVEDLEVNVHDRSPIDNMRKAIPPLLPLTLDPPRLLL